MPPRQWSLSSQQVSIPLQAMPSLQRRGVPLQAPPLHTSSTVQKRPSLQVTPSLSLQLSLERDTSQSWQGFMALICPSP